MRHQLNSTCFRIVRDTRQPDRHDIQANTLDDLDDLRALVPDLPRAEINRPGDDFRCRISCPAELLPVVLAALEPAPAAAMPAPANVLTGAKSSEDTGFHRIWAAIAAWCTDARQFDRPAQPCAA